MLIMSVLRQRGFSLAYKWRLLPQHIRKQRLHRCLARDREAGEMTATYVLIVRTNTRYVRTERSDRPGFMRKTSFLPFKPYLQLRETLFLAISMLWECIRGKKKNASLVPRPFLRGRGESGEGRKNNSTPMRIHGFIPAVSVDEGKTRISSRCESWIIFRVNVSCYGDG